MAGILIRAAGPAGIDVPRVRDQGFDDIGHLPRAGEGLHQPAGPAGESPAGGPTPTKRRPTRPTAWSAAARWPCSSPGFSKKAPVGEGGVDIGFGHTGRPGVH